MVSFVGSAIRSVSSRRARHRERMIREKPFELGQHQRMESEQTDRSPT